MLISAVSVLVAAQSSSEIPEGLMNNPVYIFQCMLERIDAIMNKVLEPITFILAHPTVLWEVPCLKQEMFSLDTVLETDIFYDSTD